MLVLPAAERHVPAIARLRMCLLEESAGLISSEEQAALLHANEAFFLENLSSGSWLTWVVEFSGEVGAVGTLAIWQRPPYPGNVGGKDAYLLNMFTLQKHRGKGAASAILASAIEAARTRGIPKMVLHATEAGRAMYLKAGFVPSGAYMELVVKSGDA